MSIKDFFPAPSWLGLNNVNKHFPRYYSVLKDLKSAPIDRLFHINPFY
jgi:hypothetical protein